MQIEEWLPIKGFEGYYEISNQGNVAKVTTSKRVLLKPYANKNGYLRIKLTKDGKRKAFYIHRLVCHAFHPNPDNLPEVDHINRVRTRNWSDNLRWVTREENLANREF